MDDILKYVIINHIFVFVFIFIFVFVFVFVFGRSWGLSSWQKYEKID